MRSWNVTVLCLVVAYLIVSSALASTLRHFISVPPEFAGEPQRYAPGTNADEAPCTQKWAGITLPAAPPMASPSNDLHPRPWDFSGPDDVPTDGPLPPCEGRGSE